MIKSIYGVLTIGLLLLTYASIGSATENICSPSPLRIAWNEYPPYSFWDKTTNKVAGRDIELINQILNKFGCKVSFINIPWARAIAGMRSNRGVDIMLYASKVEHRKKFANFSAPYRNESLRIAILTEDMQKWPIKHVSDFKKYEVRIGFNKKTWAGNELKDFINGPDGKWIINTTTLYNSLKMLFSKRIEGAVVDADTICITTQEMKIDDLVSIHPFPLYDNPVHFMLNKSTTGTALVQAISQEITRLNAIGLSQNKDNRHKCTD